MKKLLLSASLFLLMCLSIFAQDVDEDSDACKTGYWIGKNIFWIVLGIVILIFIIRMLRKKK